MYMYFDWMNLRKKGSAFLFAIKLAQLSGYAATTMNTSPATITVANRILQ